MSAFFFPDWLGAVTVWLFGAILVVGFTKNRWLIRIMGLILLTLFAALLYLGSSLRG